MKNGICVAGNMVADIHYQIERYPQHGELTTIRDPIERSVGGLVCNCIADLAALAPDIPLTALGVVGKDEEGQFIETRLSGYPSIDLSHVAHEGKTSFTAVMNDQETGARTFFQYRGANALFSERHIDWDSLHVDLMHIGYILLLDALDLPDNEYGTKLARVLHDAQARGIRTSVDIVSETGNRYTQLVPPALRYTDYCIVNELEAGRTVEIPLRDGNGLRVDAMRPALQALLQMGVSTWAVIHAPEGSFGMTKQGEFVHVPSARLPKGYIKGTTGAGDAFCSGVLTGAYREMSLKDAMTLGTAAAVSSLSQADATSGMVTAEQALSNLRSF